MLEALPFVMTLAVLAITGCAVDASSSTAQPTGSERGPARARSDEGGTAAPFSATLDVAERSGATDAGLDQSTVDAASCAESPWSASCYVCCLDANPAAVAIEQEAFRAAACDVASGGGRCRDRGCADDYCSGTAAPGAACLTCLDGIRPAADTRIALACAGNAACSALDACVATSACARKP